MLSRVPILESETHIETTIVVSGKSIERGAKSLSELRKREKERKIVKFKPHYKFKFKLN